MTRRTNTTTTANHHDDATTKQRTTSIRIPEPTWSVQGLHLNSKPSNQQQPDTQQDDKYYTVLAMRSGLPPSCVMINPTNEHASHNNRTNVAQMMQFLSMLQTRQQQDLNINDDDDESISIMETASLRLRRTTPQRDDSTTRRFTDSTEPDEAAVDPEWTSVWNAVLQSNKLVQQHSTTTGEESIGNGKEEEEAFDYFSVPKTHDPN